jgi:hypothetical protein
MHHNRQQMDVSGDTRPTQLQFIIKRKTAIPTGEFPPSPPALPNCIWKWHYVNRIAKGFRVGVTLTPTLRLVDDFVIFTEVLVILMQNMCLSKSLLEILTNTWGLQLQNFRNKFFKEFQRCPQFRGPEWRGLGA